MSLSLSLSLYVSLSLSLQSLQSELQHGHSLLKSLREKAERAAGFLEDSGAESLGGEVEARLAQLEELAGGLRQEQGSLERAVLLAREFQDRYKAQAQWLLETKAVLSGPLEPKAELYQRRAQLAKYKVEYGPLSVTFHPQPQTPLNPKYTTRLQVVFPSLFLSLSHLLFSPSPSSHPFSFLPSPPSLPPPGPAPDDPVQGPRGEVSGGEGGGHAGLRPLPLRQGQHAPSAGRLRRPVRHCQGEQDAPRNTRRVCHTFATNHKWIKVFLLVCILKLITSQLARAIPQYSFDRH